VFVSITLSVCGDVSVILYSDFVEAHWPVVTISLRRAWSVVAIVVDFVQDCEILIAGISKVGGNHGDRALAYRELLGRNSDGRAAGIGREPAAAETSGQQRKRDRIAVADEECGRFLVLSAKKNLAAAAHQRERVREINGSGGKGEEIRWAVGPSPFGWVIVGETEKGLCWLSLAASQTVAGGESGSPDETPTLTGVVMRKYSPAC
jgi:hypothetical protein